MRIPDLGAVLFDLDGTLVDTAPDLARALNAVLEEEGHPPLPLATVRPFVSHGARALVRRGFGLERSDPAFERLRLRLLALYRDSIARETALFPGMEAVLETLEGRSIPWGVVTNKPAWLTDPLLAALGLDRRAACAVSGDTASNSKPHPEPLLYACRAARVPPTRCVYVGDAERDVEAGRAAGLRTLVALFGYLGPEDRPEGWGADGLLEHPSDLLEWLP